MKKRKIVFAVLCNCLFFGTMIGCKVNAEETTENSETETTVAETIVEQESKLDDLKNWAIPTISAILGFLGACGGYLILKSLLKGIRKKMEDTINLSDDERKRLQDQYDKASKLLEEVSKNYEEAKENMKELSKDLQSKLDTLSETNLTINQLKELVGLLVASTPELVNNGFAQKIINLLDEGK